MSNKKIFTIGVISIIAFMAIASYLWYLYFNDYEGKLLMQNPNYDFSRGVELINSGSIDYINATVDDDDSIIPAYYFRVKNNGNKDYAYTLVIENTKVNDGCTIDTMFSREELEYELKLDNKVIKSGNLGSIKNNILDTNTVKASSINDYSLKIWLNKSTTEYGDKHFHYTVNIKEQ